MRGGRGTSMPRQTWPRGGAPSTSWRPVFVMGGRSWPTRVGATETGWGYPRGASGPLSRQLNSPLRKSTHHPARMGFQESLNAPPTACWGGEGKTSPPLFPGRAQWIPPLSREAWTLPREDTATVPGGEQRGQGRLQHGHEEDRGGVSLDQRPPKPPPGLRFPPPQRS